MISTKYKSSQILLTTLISVSIITLIFTSIFLIVVNTSNQAFFSNRYVSYYEISRNILVDFIQNFSLEGISINSNNIETYLNSIYKLNDIDLSLSCFLNKCEGSFYPSKLTSIDSTRSLFVIQDMDYLENFDLEKDESFEFDLYKEGPNDFRGKINFSIKTPYPLDNYLFEIGLLGKDIVNNRNRIWRDFIDLGNLSQNKLISILSIENLNINSNLNTVSFTINCNNNIDFYNNRNDLFIESGFIIQRSKLFNTSLNKNVSLSLSFSSVPTGYQLPSVARKFNVKTININSIDSSSSLTSVVPLKSSVINIFDFVLYTDSQINLR